MPSKPNEPIVIATGNPYKVAELRAIFARAGVAVVGLDEIGAETIAEPEETGDTFEANAVHKALWYARHTGRLCLADDSGLEVDALGGAPGVRSARYAEHDGSRAERDRANNERLLAELTHVPEHKRSARFVCVMALAGPPGSPAHDDSDRGVEDQSNMVVLATTRGTFEGRIGLPPDVPRGSNGFGYDPLFLLPAPETRTSAELSPSEKNARSHRGMAARRMAEKVAQFEFGGS